MRNEKLTPKVETEVKEKLEFRGEKAKNYYDRQVNPNWKELEIG